MRISWLSAEEIAAAREALRASGATWDDHFGPPGKSGRAVFEVPAIPDNARILDWEHVTEHVARAERVSEVVREQGLEVARARFADSDVAIEVATLAAAAHEEHELELDQVLRVLGCEIDAYVFYAPFLELMMELGRGHLDRIVRAYENFVRAYEAALTPVPHGKARIGAVRDGLADFYVRVDMFDRAEALFEIRHDEDPSDVAVSLSASRAFLAAGSISHAVRWLGMGAARANALGRADLATKLREKQDSVRKRMS